MDSDSTFALTTAIMQVLVLSVVYAVWSGVGTVLTLSIGLHAGSQMPAAAGG